MFYLIEQDTNQVLIDYEIFDPLNGIIPKVVDREIDIKSDIDIAFYNNTTDTNKNIVLENAWGDLQTGKVWWDISNAVYVNYDQGDIDYKTRYWGQLLSNSSIDVYEWTKSTVIPDEYENLVGTIIDGVEISGVPYSVINQFGDRDYYWCEDAVVNLNTGQVETYYYFWVKNKTNVINSERRYSVLQIANIIEDPENEQIRWVAATGENSFLVTGLTQIARNIDLLIKIDFHSLNNDDYHQEFVLLAEEDPKTVIPEWLHISLRDSLVGYSNVIKYAEYENYNDSNTYQKDDVVHYNDDTNHNLVNNDSKFYISVIDNNNQALNINNNSNWNLLDVVDNKPSGDVENFEQNYRTIGYITTKPVPDTTLHPNVRYGIQKRPNQSWFINLDNARKAFFTKLNSQLIEINLLNSSLDWKDAFDSKYWSYVDWNENYNKPFEERLIDQTIDTYYDLLNIENSETNTIVFVNDNQDNDNIKRKAAYRYENNNWKLIYKQNATIQINENVWNKLLRTPAQTNRPSGWDLIPWDSYLWDDGLDVFIRTVLDSLFNKLWTGVYASNYNDLWFFMAKHVLREQENVDWIFKTSYLKMNWNIPLQQRHNNYVEFKDEELYNYIDNVKPFRTKTSDSSINPEKIESVEIGIGETVVISDITDPNNPIDKPVRQD